MKKILVIGSGGAGKSTFARKLGSLLNIEVLHLDKFYWRPDWQKTPDSEWTTVVQKLLAGDSWIMDGNFGGTREIRFRAADTVIWLDTPRWICIYRILKRGIQYRNKRRPDMAEGCNERFDWDFIKWVWNYPNRGKRQIAAELAALSDKTIVVLRRKREIDSFFRGLADSATKPKNDFCPCSC